MANPITLSLVSDRFPQFFYCARHNKNVASMLSMRLSGFLAKRFNKFFIIRTNQTIRVRH